ncbi:MAG: hypothetical protein P8J20_11745 [Novosphingobium sp.]|nr:hypothetical protein [Novosphingobium sp.]
MRDSSDIQFAPLPPIKPLETPSWLKKLGEFLESIFGPVGEALGMSWPILQNVLIALAIALVLFVLWRLIAPVIEARRGRPAPEEPEWSPDHNAAVALLEDADRLASQGLYAQATHLLLQRSVSHIADAKPDWLIPASTAREIAALPLLPARAREAFGTIAVRVERSLFALRDLDRQDWDVARAAYSDFALMELPS